MAIIQNKIILTTMNVECAAQILFELLFEMDIPNQWPIAATYPITRICGWTIAIVECVT